MSTKKLEALRALQLCVMLFSSKFTPKKAVYGDHEWWLLMKPSMKQNITKNPIQFFGFVAWPLPGGCGPQNLISKYEALSYITVRELLSINIWLKNFVEHMLSIMQPKSTTNH